MGRSHRLHPAAAACMAVVILGVADSTPADDNAKALQLYRDVYGADHDRAAKSKDPAEKVKFAGRLAAAAKVAVEDAAFARLLADRAIEFASSDPSGHPLALELLRGRLSGDGPKLPVCEAVADLLEKSLRAAKAGARADAAGELVKAYSDLARENAKAGRPDAAIKALVRAKVIVRAELKGSKELLAELDQQTEAVNKRRRDEARLAAAQQTLRDSAGDPAANGVVGLHHLMAGDPAKAAPHLAKSADPLQRRLGESLLSKEPKPVETADAYRALAAAAADKDDRNALYTRAVALYQQALDMDPKHPDGLRIKLVLTQIADASGIRPTGPAVPPDPAVAPKPADPTPAAGKPGLRERSRIAAGAEIRAAAFAPDGSVLAGGAADGTLHLWEMPAGRERSAPAAHSGPVRCVAFSPSGKFVATGGADGVVRVWPAGGGRAPAKVNAHGPGVNAVAFSPDGRILGTAGDDKSVKLWELPDDPAEFTGRDREALTGLPGNVKSIRFVPGSAGAVFGCAEGKAVLFDKNLAGKPFADFAHDESIGPLAVAPDGKTLAVGGASGTVRLWKVATREAAGSIKAGKGAVAQVEFAPDGEWIATLSDGMLRLWRTSDSTEWTAFDAGSPTLAFAVARDAKSIAVACADRTVRLVEVIRPGR